MLIWRRDISQNSRNGEGSREAGRAWFRLVVFKGAILNPKKGCAAGLWQYTMVYRRIWMGSSDRAVSSFYKVISGGVSHPHPLASLCVCKAAPRVGGFQLTGHHW